MNAPRFGSAAIALMLLTVVSLAGRAQSAWRDEPLKIIQTTDAEFPFNHDTMFLRRGEARVVLNVDADGRLVDCLVTSYTHRDFAAAAVQALKEWRYEPARQRGETVGTRASLVFNFEVKGQVLSLNALEGLSSQLNFITGVQRTDRIAQPHELDHPLQPVQTVAPRTIGASTLTAPKTVVVDFFIDETGRPRMPVVLDSQDQQAAAAVDALMQWRYTAPMKEGSPIAVRARQAFVFTKNP